MRNAMPSDINPELHRLAEKHLGNSESLHRITHKVSSVEDIWTKFDAESADGRRRQACHMRRKGTTLCSRKYVKECGPVYNPD